MISLDKINDLLRLLVRIYSDDFKDLHVPVFLTDEFNIIYNSLVHQSYLSDVISLVNEINSYSEFNNEKQLFITIKGLSNPVIFKCEYCFNYPNTIEIDLSLETLPGYNFFKSKHICYSVYQKNQSIPNKLPEKIHKLNHCFMLYLIQENFYEILIR
jgi:predicted flavoprotein YhiN